DDALLAVDNVLTGVHADGSASQLFLPGDLVVDLLQGRDATLAGTGIRPVTDAAPAVAAPTGIRVDGTLVLDRLAFAGLVDAIGGITVDVREPVVARDRFGNVTAVIPLGTRTLDGPEAAMYALTLNRGEPESARQARFTQAWNAVLVALPSEPERVRAILGNLGALARSDQATATQADVLAGAGRAMRSHRMAMADLAVVPGAEGPDPITWVDPAAAEVQARTLFASEVLPPAQPPVRVRLYAGAATIAQTQVLRDQLSRAGFSVVWAGRAAAPAATATGSASSIVVAGPEFLRFGQELARVVGLSTAAVKVDASASPGAPLTLTYSAPAASPSAGAGDSGAPSASADVTSSGG
ncbi:MAG: LCP family protein, partial [Candidatus Nanopelagicales bacterium]